jgi:transposase
MVDIDETSNSPATFMAKYGWSPKGQECTVRQIAIGGKSYCTIAAVSPRGFIYWEIYEGTVDGAVFVSFLRNLRIFLMPDQFGIVDNAAIHHTEDAREALENCFVGGRYAFCAKYSPHLKPIERCFALVKNWVRERDEAAVRNPIQVINAAFDNYSVGKPGASSVRGHWVGYFNMYDAYLNEFA